MYYEKEKEEEKERKKSECSAHAEDLNDSRDLDIMTSGTKNQRPTRQSCQRPQGEAPRPRH